MQLVEVTLALACVDIMDSSKTRFCLKEDNTLPTTTIPETQTSQQSAKRLFKEITGSDSDWFIVKQVGAQEYKPNTVTILYSVMIPEQVPLVDDIYRWVEYKTINENPEALYLFSKACGYNKVEQ